MDKRTIEQKLAEVRVMRQRLNDLSEQLLTVDTFLDKWASEMPDEEETF